MKTISNKYFLLLFLTFLSLQIFGESNYKQKKILVVVQGSSQLTNLAMGDGRQLAQLLGHFNTITDVIGVDDYKASSINNYDYIFYFFNNQYPDFGGSACTLVRFVKIFYALLEGCRIGDVKDCL